MRPGDVLADRFQLEREVAIGGVGVIWRARDRVSELPVAVKLLRVDEPRQRARFLREIALLGALDHPGIVRQVAHGSSVHGTPYLVMEWLSGVDLDHYLRRGGEALASGSGELQPLSRAEPGHADGPEAAGEGQEASPRLRSVCLSEAELRALGLRLAAAAAELHRRDVVHCDISPANLFLRERDPARVTLLDLGSAYGPWSRVEGTSAAHGTLAFMAPEQLEAGAALTPATDVWAMGCVFYLCLSGCPAFSGASPQALRACIRSARPASPRTLRPELSADLAALITDMLAPAPGDRPPDAAAVAAALRR
ncbi:serine/threonine-protein kinase [Haliangium ochraceum]|uniref:Serine/threonine protein kinase n=1 Tax=Haliangium ochraceum (strain DSM 14365 / JCM 11303 / SMP-2) TaxID=502025 RepID=D0LN69_HALO1|nr:serine/threonine-protein kinase [Haliangium ochraceum]ACY15246.1 serine/threonine protein kinase [Haliangium ochraceum DSM 14365]